MRSGSLRTKILFTTVVLAVVVLGAACMDFSKFSKAPVSVSFSITDPDGNPLEHVEARLEGPQKYGPAATQADGTVVFPFVVPGNYQAIVRYPDGLEDIRRVPVWGGKDLVLAFERGAFSVETRVADDFSGGLNDSVWAVYDYIDYSKAGDVGSDPSPVVVRDGRLIFQNFHTGGWTQNQGGIVLREALDLTGATTVVDIAYAEHNWSELNPGFFNEFITGGEDIFNINGFRLTVEPNYLDTRFSFGGEGSFQPGFNTGLSAAPFKIRWVLTHEQGQDFTVKVYVDGDLKHQGRLNIGTMNAEAVHFYLWVANNAHQGPSAIDEIVLFQVYEEE